MPHKRWCLAKQKLHGHPILEPDDCNCGVTGKRASLLHRMLIWFWHA